MTEPRDGGTSTPARGRCRRRCAVAVAAAVAAAGIPQYWIVRMTGNDGPAISVERFLLSAGGLYVSIGLAVRGRDFHAVDVIDPFRVAITGEHLDDGL
jgi:hypothetical protein